MMEQQTENGQKHDYWYTHLWVFWSLGILVVTCIMAIITCAMMYCPKWGDACYLNTEVVPEFPDWAGVLIAILAVVAFAGLICLIECGTAAGSRCQKCGKVHAIYKTGQLAHAHNKWGDAAGLEYAVRCRYCGHKEWREGSGVDPR